MIHWQHIIPRTYRRALVKYIDTHDFFFTNNQGRHLTQRTKEGYVPLDTSQTAPEMNDTTETVKPHRNNSDKNLASAYGGW